MIIIFLLLNNYNMADNPNKKKADGKRVSQQPHEQAYQKRKAAAKKNSGSKGKRK
jgi:hypothetical protein